jgi:hypothetical protein
MNTGNFSRRDRSGTLTTYLGRVPRTHFSLYASASVRGSSIGAQILCDFATFYVKGEKFRTTHAHTFLGMVLQRQLILLQQKHKTTIVRLLLLGKRRAH